MMIDIGCSSCSHSYRRIASTFLFCCSLFVLSRVITGPENTYFERCFEALGVSEQEISDTPTAEVTSKFCNLMTDAAKSQNLEEMLAVIVVCEWAYLSWGQAVLANKDQPVCRKDFVTYEWVDLHSGPGFESVIAYLRGLLDREGERLKATSSDDRLKNCERRFLEAVNLEEEFFDFAYKSD